MTKDEFLLREALWETPGATQRSLSEKLGVSLGKIHTLITAARESGEVSEEGTLTEKGLCALEPYRVRNAVIMAAGTSSRFAPLSFEKPKGLFTVRGEVMIERQIRQLKERGITEIYVVVGYMKELFYYLEKKFGVKILVNREFQSRNNLSSVLAAQEVFGNSYLCYSDNYLQKNPYRSYVWRSYFAAQYSEGYTDEYVLKTDKNGKIVQYYPAGEDCWYQMGEMYFDRKTAQDFLNLLKKEYDYPGIADMKVDDFFMRHLSSLDFYMEKRDSDAVLEFDNITEIEAFDDQFLRNMGENILTNICRTLSCKETEICDVERISAGNTNVIFSFRVKDASYIYRHPGLGSDKIIDRNREEIAMKKAAEIGLDPTLIACDSKKGWKICRFIENVGFDYENLSDEERGVRMLSRFHRGKEKHHLGFRMDMMQRAKEIGNLVPSEFFEQHQEYAVLRQQTEKLYRLAEADGYEPEMCHNDCCDTNILLGKTGTFLIDWEYAGDNDPAADLSTFIIGARHSREEVERILSIYFDRKPDEKERRHFYAWIAICAYFYYTWGIFEENLGKDIGDLSYIWYRYIEEYLPLATAMYENEEEK